MLITQQRKLQMKSAKKPRVIITGGSLLNGINEKGLSKDNHVKRTNFPGGTTETSLGEVEELVKNKPDTLIVHTGTKIKIGKKVFTTNNISVFESDYAKR